MVDYQSISIMLTGIGMIIALTYYALQIRNQNRTRQAQLFMQIYDHYVSVEYKKQAETIYFDWEWSDYDDYNEKYGVENNRDANTIWSSIITFYEGVGVLVSRGLIDKSLVDDLMSGSITRLWDKMGPILIEHRRRANWPQVAEWFEYLYNQIKPIVEEQHPELKT